LELHLHVLALDGAYTLEHGKAHFHRAPAPRPGETFDDYELIETEDLWVIIDGFKSFASIKI
jgi:hypothetical protein